MAYLLLPTLANLGQTKEKSMNVSKMIPAFVVTFALGVTAYPVMAKQEHKTKVKSTETKATKDNSGRQAGDCLPGWRNTLRGKVSFHPACKKRRMTGS